MLHIYNSLTRQKEVFKPIEPHQVRMYVCGMTVYDYCHLGHARVMVVFDTVYRYFKARGYAVDYVRNITDIDDKIIKRAAENNEPIAALTQRFIDAMHEDEDALNVRRPTSEPRATDNVPEMLAMIQTLLDKGMAYQGKNGDVYYDVSKFDGYGKLSGRKLDELRAGERVAVDEVKDDPLDFVLWKAVKPDEPAWDAPWGQGRPGWHIECSCRRNCWGIISTFTAAAAICSSRTMKTKLRKVKAASVTNTSITGCITALFASMMRKCPNHWAISSPSAKCCVNTKRRIFAFSSSTAITVAN